MVQYPRNLDTKHDKKLIHKILIDKFNCMVDSDVGISYLSHFVWDLQMSGQVQVCGHVPLGMD